MKKKAIGFLGGQLGDQIICLGAVKVLAEDYPDTDFTMAMSEKFSAIAPLFENQPYIKDIHIWQGYDAAWPTENDKKFIIDNKYDLVFNPMDNNQHPRWFQTMHQVSSTCQRYGLRLPDTNEVFLKKNFKLLPMYKNHIALSVFANNGEGVKSLSVGRAQELVDNLKSMGHKVLQLHGPKDPVLKNLEVISKSFVKAAQVLHSCKLLVTGDTAMSWVASAYKIPTLGLYAYSYHPNATTSVNWQPINPNAKYLEANIVANIPNDLIIEEVGKIL